MQPDLNGWMAASLHHLERAHAMAPDVPRYSRLLGRALLIGGRPKAALPLLLMGVEETSPPAIFFMVALAQMSAGDLPAAVSWADRALAEPIHLPKAHALRGEALSRLGEHARATKDWRQARALAPDEDLYRIKLGAALLREAAAQDPGEGSARLVSEACEVLLAGLPAHHQGEHRYLVACALLSAGEPRQALVHLERTTYPNAEELAVRRAMAHTLLGRFREAEAALEAGTGTSDSALIGPLVASRRVPDAATFALPTLNGFLPLELTHLIPLIQPGELPAGAPVAVDIHLEPRVVHLDMEALLIPQPTPEAEPAHVGDATWEMRKATELLDTARLRMEQQRGRLAAATLARAFDILARPGLEGKEVDRLKMDVLRALLQAAGDDEGTLALIRRADVAGPVLFQRDQDLGRAIIEHVVSTNADDPSLPRLLVSFVASKRRSSPDLHRSVHRILSARLSIHLSSGLASAERHVELLYRLHCLRPSLAYPRLYLGRWLTLKEEYAHARTMLGGIRGRLAQRPRVLNLRGRCAELLGLRDEAEALFRKSLQLRDDQPDIHFRLGRASLTRALRQGAGATTPVHAVRKREPVAPTEAMEVTEPDA